MEEEKIEEEKPIEEEVCILFESKLKDLKNDGYNQSNSEYWCKTMDNLKDVYKIKKYKEEIKMYRDYGRDNADYNARMPYGRRGVPGTGRSRYRGEEALDEMKYHYGNYQDNYDRGNYGAKEDSSYKMMEAFKDFVYAVGEELEPKDKQMFKQAMQEMTQRLN